MIGSIVSSLNASDVDGSLGRLPPQLQVRAEDSIGAASAIAPHLPAQSGSALLATTGDAYSQAMGNGLLIGAALTAVAAVIVARFLPGRSAAETGRARVGDRTPAISERI